MTYYTIIEIFNLTHMFVFNKSCFNDTLISLYLLSSTIFTIGLLAVILLYIVANMYKYLQKVMVVIFIILFFYFLNKNFGSNFINVFFKIHGINTTLQNGLLNIHPVYIYSIYSYAFIFWFYNYKYYFCNYRLDTVTKKYKLVFLIITGMYLGAFWASQELNWGGFWSWDPVELISLFFFFWLIFYLHSRSNKYLNKPLTHLMISTVLIFFIIRLGVISTIHSFITNSLKNIFINIYMYIIIIVNMFNLYLYYCIYNKYYKYNFVLVFLISLIYIYIYILLLIYSQNIKLISPVYMYFFMTYIGIYCVHIFNFNLYVIVLLYILIVIINSHYFLLILLSAIFIYRLLFIKNIQIHIVYMLLYTIFFIFFINVNVYNNISIVNNLNININNSTNSYILDNFYELSFFIKKFVFLDKIKNFIAHISGFSIKNNIMAGFYLFSKNNLITYVFSLEIVYILFFYYGLFYIFNYFNYVYKLIKYLIKNY